MSDSEQAKKTIWERLAAPTPPDEIKWREGPGGKPLRYVDARWVRQRLTDACGPANWQSRFTFVSDRIAVCEISVRNPENPTEWITRSDGADPSTIEGPKGMLSDAQKRTGVCFGIAADLYEPEAGAPQKPENLPQRHPQAPPPFAPPVATSQEKSDFEEILDVKAVEDRVGKSGKSFFRIIFADNRSATTFDTLVKAAAMKALVERRQVGVVFTRKGDFLNILEFRLLGKES